MPGILSRYVKAPLDKSAISRNLSPPSKGLLSRETFCAHKRPNLRRSPLVRLRVASRVTRPPPGRMLLTALTLFCQIRGACSIPRLVGDGAPAKNVAPSMSGLFLTPARTVDVTAGARMNPSRRAIKRALGFFSMTLTMPSKASFIFLGSGPATRGICAFR